MAYEQSICDWFHETALFWPQATFALLEEGRPKKWESRLTGGKSVLLHFPRLCADSGVRAALRVAGLEGAGPVPGLCS